MRIEAARIKELQSLLPRHQLSVSRTFFDFPSSLFGSVSASLGRSHPSHLPLCSPTSHLPRQKQKPGRPPTLVLAQLTNCHHSTARPRSTSTSASTLFNANLGQSPPLHHHHTSKHANPARRLPIAASPIPRDNGTPDRPRHLPAAVACHPPRLASTRGLCLPLPSTYPPPPATNHDRQDRQWRRTATGHRHLVHTPQRNQQHVTSAAAVGINTASRSSLKTSRTTTSTTKTPVRRRLLPAPAQGVGVPRQGSARVRSAVA